MLPRPGDRSRRITPALLSTTFALILVGACTSTGATSAPDANKATRAEAPGGSTSAEAPSSTSDTIEPGVLQVAIYPNGMPYVGVEDGRLTGLDGDLINHAADRLGVAVEVTTLDFGGLLSAVQTQRVDVGIGDIGWRQARAETGRFTDPPYYSAVAMAVRKGLGIHTVGDLEGLTIGTLTGGFYTSGLTALPNVTVRVYEQFTAEVDDLQAGRIDLFFYDPFALFTLKEKRPELDFDVRYIVPPTAEEVAAHPQWDVFRPFMTGWYLPPNAGSLQAKLDEIIWSFYEDGTAVETAEKWGGSPEEMLVPQPQFAEQRTKVDRPAGWQPPSIEP